MTWAPVSDKERKQYECVRMERLTDDQGRVLGSVMMFNTEEWADGEKAICYPIGIKGRLGAYRGFEKAKKAVEKALEQS